jgi:HAD superfamily hydrolase (TIGR01509 family)
MIIFDCDGVLVDSEPIAAAVAAEALTRAGFAFTPDLVARQFTGMSDADMLAAVEAAAGRQLPPDFAAALLSATNKRLQAELRPMPHAAEMLARLDRARCVASSSGLERVRLSLEVTGLIAFFAPHLYSASEVARGKPAPDLFLYAAENVGVAPSECVVVEDSESGVAAALAAGMTPIGFAGGSHVDAGSAPALLAAGARAVVTDLRDLPEAFAELERA